MSSPSDHVPDGLSAAPRAAPWLGGNTFGANTPQPGPGTSSSPGSPSASEQWLHQVDQALLAEIGRTGSRGSDDFPLPPRGLVLPTPPRQPGAGTPPRQDSPTYRRAVDLVMRWQDRPSGGSVAEAAGIRTTGYGSPSAGSSAVRRSPGPAVSPPQPGTGREASR